MNKLVFLEPNHLKSEPFTTSKVIAEFTGIEHRKLRTTLRKHMEAIESFGLSTPYEAESSGGRPEIIYKLNEQQATLLITFLKNTPVVVKFKVELVRQFYAMREELLKRHIAREQLKPVRREMTDVIQLVATSKWAYKQYTDLSYKVALGEIASKIRQSRGAEKKAKAVDYLTAEELEEVTKLQYQIAVLLELGMEYEQVKATVSNRLALSA